MKKITLFLLALVGFWSANAQLNRLMSKEQARAFDQMVHPIQHHFNHLRSPNATTFLSEDFNAGALPAGWTVVDNAGDGFEWAVVNDYNGNSLDGTSFAFVDSDAAGQAPTLDTELLSPVVNTAGAAHLALSFDQFFKTYTGSDVADVDVYDGTQWVNVYSTSTDVGGWGNPDHQLIDVTAYANSNFKVRFHYHDANYEYYWAVDNVSLIDLDANDLAATDFLPETALPNVPFTLSGHVYNYGFAAQDTFDVIFNIKDASNTVVFTETVNVTGASLTTGNSYAVSATTPASLAAGTYTVEISSSLANDDNTANDMYSSNLYIIDYTTTYDLDKVYSYDTSDLDNSGDDNSIITFDINSGAPTALNQIVTNNFITTGTFINNVLVVIEYDSNAVYLVDGTTGAAHKYGYLKGDITSASNSVSGIAFDSALNQVYVTEGSALFTLNPLDLSTTFIGMLNSGGAMLGIDFDNNGNLYGIDIADDNLYSIDPTTGAATAIGPLGIDIAYAQDMGADPTTGNLYGTLFQYDQTATPPSIGGLYSIDKITGAATAIGTPGQDEYTVCAIKGTTVAISENTIEGLRVYPNPTNGNLLINAKENIENIKVLNLAGQEVMTVDNNGLNAQLDLSNLTSGAYILKIATDQTVATYQVIKK